MKIAAVGNIGVFKTEDAGCFEPIACADCELAEGFASIGSKPTIFHWMLHRLILKTLQYGGDFLIISFCRICGTYG